MTLIAILLPWLSFILRGRILTGILCLLLQITIVGWIPAAAWADRRNLKIVKAIKRSNR
ncbi:MAG: YqaE/Pmp3 family membrane protein [Chitinophagaceae bacterium]